MNLRCAPAECRRDLAEAQAIAREFARELRADAAGERSRRRAGLRLALEWAALIAVTYAIACGPLPTGWKLLLLVPWSLYSSLALDNVAHYLNHWPPFLSPWANLAWRTSGILIFFTPLEIDHVHAAHHRSYARPGAGDRVFEPADRERSFWGWLAREALGSAAVLAPWRALPPGVARLRTARPAHFREILLARAGCLAWALVLVALDPLDTLLFFLPTTVLVGSFASLVMNLTDHVPGDPAHPFRLATHFAPASRLERGLSALNHHTAATHLTHHLFPHIHWVHLPELQARLLPLYARQRTPRSRIVNTLLVGNPLALVRVLRALARDRYAPE